MPNTILSQSILSALVVFIPLQMAVAEPIFDTKNSYLDIRGTTVEEIKNSVGRHAAMQKPFKKIAWVKSTWGVDWTFWWREGPEGCYATAVEAKVTFENITPNWIDQAQATPEMRARWRRTKAALDLYLQQIVSGGEKAVKEIEQLHRRVEPQKTCNELELNFNRAANRTINLYRKREREIANRVGHGSNQIPDLADPISIQTPVAASPTVEVGGWCELSSDLENVRQEICGMKRTCVEGTANCTIQFEVGDDRILVEYEDGEPLSWNEEPAGYAFINRSSCVQNSLDKTILCFWEQKPEGNWFFHLP